MISHFEEDTLRQILEAYDELYYYMLAKPDSIWKTENMAIRLNVDQLETMQEMLEAYTEIQDYTKCHNIQGWINSLRAIDTSSSPL